MKPRYRVLVVCGVITLVVTVFGGIMIGRLPHYEDLTYPHGRKMERILLEGSTESPLPNWQHGNTGMGAFIGSHITMNYTEKNYGIVRTLFDRPPFGLYITAFAIPNTFTKIVLNSVTIEYLSGTRVSALRAPRTVKLDHVRYGDGAQYFGTTIKGCIDPSLSKEIIITIDATLHYESGLVEHMTIEREYKYESGELFVIPSILFYLGA